MARWYGVLAAAAVLASSALASAPQPSRLVPFVLPWDDASPGVTNASAWLHKPAGKFGPVHAGKDGHLYAGAQRIRFFGVNLCFDATLPRKEDADKIAARMAKFGINVVRFHHMDMFAFPAGIRARNSTSTSDLDPEALDRLDYLIAQLKRHGIYANLNLLVSRPFQQSDGLPADIERVDWKDRHVVGFFHEPILRLQKEYARNLLTHLNPYTQLTYAEDPATAFVEVNNEDGLMQGWLGNQVDRLPSVFLKDLQRQWNAWLHKRYDTTEKLRRAWGVKQEPLGEELLSNHDFARGVEGWSLEQHGTAKAAAAASDDLPEPLRSTPQKSVRLVVAQTSAEAWHVQFNQANLKAKAGRALTLTFWARADKPRTVSAELGQAHAPWKQLGLQANVNVTTEWKPFRFVFLTNAADANARLDFTNLASQEGTVWLAGVSLRTGGTVGLAGEERIEKGSVPVFSHARFGERTAEAQRDWLRFLWETEDSYWQAMQHYLKDDLHVRAVVVGTIVGCSTPNLMAGFDAVDTHAYWQHPQFSGREWDAGNWTVANRSMVNEAGGTLPGLALRRVLGKPHCVTEYNHSAPNTFGSEAFLLLAAYGALQDWDAIYAFAYEHSSRWDARHIQGFFDIAQHPTKLATLPAAVALFLRGDVRPAEKQIVAGLDKEQEVDLLRHGYAWDLVHAGQLGVPREAALVHRVAIATEGMRQDARRPVEKGDRTFRHASDTSELLWNLTDRKHGVVTIDTPKSKAIIGYGGGQRFDLSGVIIEPGATAQEGWSAITLTAMAGNVAARPARLLVTATGLAENTDMRWKDAAKNSVGRDWGKAPSLVEVVPARITLPVPAKEVYAWALDGRGQRQAAIPVKENGNGNASLTVGSAARTLWYEIEVK